MTTTLSLGKIRELLEDKGFRVVLGPPSRAVDNQFSLEIRDMKLTVEGTTLYNLYTFVNIGFSTSNPDDIETIIQSTITTVEEGIHTDLTIGRGTFTFEEDIKLEHPGELYIITIPCRWFKQIQITV